MKKICLFLLITCIFFTVSCAVNRQITADNKETKIEESAVKKTAENSYSLTSADTATPAETLTPKPSATIISKPLKDKTGTAQAKIKKTEAKKEAQENDIKKKSALTETEKPKDLMDRIKKSQEARTALTAGLIIDTFDSASGASQRIEADIIIKKKDKFIVKYKKPAEQLLVSDGKTLWVYTPQLEQAIRQKLEDANLNMNFYVEMESSLDYYAGLSDVKSYDEGKNHVISMVPKKKGTVPFDSMEAGFSKETLLPSYMNAKYEGMDIKVKFINPKAYNEQEAAANPEMADINFIFRPPQGTEIMEGSELLKGSTIIK